MLYSSVRGDSLQFDQVIWPIFRNFDNLVPRAICHIGMEKKRPWECLRPNMIKGPGTRLVFHNQKIFLKSDLLISSVLIKREKNHKNTSVFHLLIRIQIIKIC